MAPQPQRLRIWQWNCRGYKNKRSDLLFRVQHAANKPDVIALQEATLPARLAGYTSFIPANADPQGGSRLVAVTLVQRNIAAIQHEFDHTSVTHTMIEIPPRKKGDGNVFILNIYTPPSDRTCAISGLVRKAVKLADKAPLLIVGDFNAPHPAWGYRKPNIKAQSFGKPYRI